MSSNRYGPNSRSTYDGALYFTDPPFGLPKVYDDARKELPYSGVFRWFDGKLQLVAKELLGPNGIAFSPDEKYLYVTNWDTALKWWCGTTSPPTEHFSTELCSLT